MMNYVSTDHVVRQHSVRQIIYSSTVMEPVCSCYVHTLTSDHSHGIQAMPFHLVSLSKKVNQSLYRPGQTLRIPVCSNSQISRQSAQEGGKVVSPMHQLPLPP